MFENIMNHTSPTWKLLTCMRGHAGLMILVFCQRLCDINLARDLNFLLYHLGQEEL